MLQNVLLFTLLAVGVSVSDGKAIPPTTRSSAPPSIPFSARFKFDRTTRIIDADRARVTALKNHAASVKGTNAKRAGAFSVNVTNNAVTYLASVGVGSPPTQFNLLIDTGLCLTSLLHRILEY
jgi:hypothetical protein